MNDARMKTMNEKTMNERKKSQMNQDLATACARSRDLIRLGFDSTSAWKFVFVKWFPDNPMCTQDVTLLPWAKLQQVSAAPRDRKLLHKERRSELIKMYNWYLEVLRDRVWSRFELWTFEELTDLKPDYRQDWLSHPSLGFHKLSANFPFQHANFSGDRYTNENEAATNKDWVLSLSNTRRVICLS